LASPSAVLTIGAIGYQDIRVNVQSVKLYHMLPGFTGLEISMKDSKTES